MGYYYRGVPWDIERGVPREPEPPLGLTKERLAEIHARLDRAQALADQMPKKEREMLVPKSWRPSKDIRKARSSNPKAGTIYVVQDASTGLYKIGRTTNMRRRMRELGVGKTTRLVSSREVSDAAAVEKAAHRKYKDSRLPQTEYFRLSSPPKV